MTEYNHQQKNYESFTGRIMFNDGTTPKHLEYEPIQLIGNSNKKHYINTLINQSDTEK